MNKIKSHIVADLHLQKVVQANDLITSVAKMDRIPLKIFELAVSYIDIENPPKDHTILLSKRTLFSFFEVSSKNKNTRFKQAIEKMQKQAFFEIKEIQGKGYKYKSIIPIPYVEWDDYSDTVIIRFDAAIMPYLVELKTNFTQYLITDIMGLKSKYSVILYKWLSMNYNQFEHYQHTLKRSKKQLESYKNPTISLKDLREMTDTVTDYTDMFSNFDKWILKKPLREINEHTHFNVNYEKIKDGRTIVAIKFIIEKKEQAPYAYYKEEQEDPVYLEEKLLRQEEKLKLHIEAQQSPYTELLLSAGLLEFSDALNTNTMIELSKFVYPLYDRLKALKNITEVERHINYVKDHQENYSKKNKSKYLKNSIVDYLQTIEFKSSINGK